MSKTAPSKPARLSDTQLVILSAAAARKDSSVLPVPKSIKVKGAALTKVLNKLLRQGLIMERAAQLNEEHWRTDAEGQRHALYLTEACLDALDVEPPSKPRRPKSGGQPSKQERKPTRSKAPTRASAITPTKGRSLKKSGDTKAATILRLLRRARGATIDELVAASGWQAHSVRGFLSGTLKKKQGLDVVSAKDACGTRRYRVTG